MDDSGSGELSTLTCLLREAEAGRPGAMDEVMGRVYADLCRVAERYLARDAGRDPAGLSLEPAALVNETYLRLIKQRRRYDNRGQFFAIATRTMLRVLTNYHRDRRTAKRGGRWVRVTLAGMEAGAAGEPSFEIPAFVEAIEQLEELDAGSAEIAKLYLIWGLTIPEIARATGRSVATIERDWAFTRKWLAARLRGSAA